MGISVVVVGIGGLSVVIYDTISSRQHLLSRVDTMAEITAANCSAAMAFNDEQDATEVLMPLGARPDVDFSGLFYNDGSPFVTTGTNDASAKLPEGLLGHVEQHEFTGQRLVVQRKVLFGEDQVGWIVLVANLQAESERGRAFLFITGAAMTGLIGVALLLGARLQRLVSDPIAQLAAAANEIRRNQDYSIRVPKQSEDEVGSLVLAFNQMLDEIERQNHSVMEGEARLKLALSASNMGTWEWDPVTDEISCSSETKRIFGCPTSKTDLATFAQRLHPQDAEGVLAALWNTQSTGEPFSSEYRVITPERKLVWVAHVGRQQPETSSRQKLFIGIVQEISLRKQIEAERQKLAANLLHAEEEERRRIARELHDTTAQHLAALKMNLIRLCDSNAQSVTPDPALANQSRQLLDQALQELRTLTYVLHPPVLEEFGLVGALKDFAAGVSRRNDIQVTVDAETYHGRMSPTTELTLFRVVQESVTNAVRHSGTREILIQLSRVNSEARLVVKDFGRGMPAHDTPSENHGVGIGSMKERLALIGGELIVESTPQGVLVQATTPDTEEDTTAPTTQSTT